MRVGYKTICWSVMCENYLTTVRWQLCLAYEWPNTAAVVVHSGTLGLLEGRIKIHQVARSKECFPPTIINLICRYQETNSVNDCPSLETETVTTPVQDRSTHRVAAPRGVTSMVGSYRGLANTL